MLSKRYSLLSLTFALSALMGGMFILIVPATKQLIYQFIFILVGEWEHQIRKNLLLYFTLPVFFISGLSITWAYIYRVSLFNYLKSKYSDIKNFSTHLLISLTSFEVLLILLSFIVKKISYSVKIVELYHITHYFHIGLERNIPSAFSAMQLIITGCVTLYCRRLDINLPNFYLPRKHIWLSISLIFFYMGIDEFFMFHESYGNVLKRSDLIPHAFHVIMSEYVGHWTIIGAMIAGIIGVAGIWAFRRIFSDYLYLFYLLILSGAIFLFGAIGMESIQHYYACTYETGNYGKYMQMIEEFFEMFGVSLALFVFLRYIAEIKKLKPTKPVEQTNTIKREL